MSRKEALHGLIDSIDEKEFDTVFKVLLKFVKEDAPLPDEVEAIESARREILDGELYSHEDVWN